MAANLSRGDRATFSTRLMGVGEVRLALPLARLLYPGLTELAWTAYAGAVARRVLVACNPGGYLHGLCTLSDGFDLRCGRTLDVDDFIVASFVDTKSVAQALLDGVEEVARSGGYQEVRVDLADSNLPQWHAVADTLNSSGHVRTMGRFTKPLMPAMQPPVGG